MAKRLVGRVTDEEKLQIRRLFERKNGLAELAVILTADDTGLYDRLVRDMGETCTGYRQWWDDMARKYGWESTPGGRWEIDFDNGDIYLIEGSE